MNSTNLSSLIWSTADDVLRGVFKPSEYGRIILPFVVFRRLDCVLEPKKDEILELQEKYKDLIQDTSPVIQSQIGLPFFNNSKFDFARLKSDPNNIRMSFDNYVHGFSRNVFDIIESFSVGPFVEKLEKHERLYMLIDKFTQIDLYPSSVDNHQMGTVYEELLRKFSEMSNEERGDHFTPRDIVKLLVSFVFGGAKEDLEGEGEIRSVYVPCYGPGGMLTIGKEWIHQKINESLKINLYGQELNDTTYANCKSDLLMLGENPEIIYGPCSSISDDRLQGQTFDYTITNPPFGVSWKRQKDFGLEEIKDPSGRFAVGNLRISDSSLLFLQHQVHKISLEGSRIGIVFNGSPLFTGDAEIGESEIRKWVIENNWLETIVHLPDELFFNTGITTYFWISMNRKAEDRKGMIQLIDDSIDYQNMKKSLESKRLEASEVHTRELFGIYKALTDGEFSKIYSNDYFGFTRVIMEQPLMQNGVVKANKSGKPKPDSKKRDDERLPLEESVKHFYEREVRPDLSDSWYDRKTDKVGCEINLSKYFYRFKPLRLLEQSTILFSLVLFEKFNRHLQE